MDQISSGSNERPPAHRGRVWPAPGRSAKTRHPGWIGWLALAAVVAAPVIVAAYAGLPSGGRARAAIGVSSSGGALKPTAINGAVVLTNAKGFTVYSFAPDTRTSSMCNGQCAKFWPPVEGPVTATAGVTGEFGTITRSDGGAQATYNGHPLYTYVGDAHPGQANGNNLKLNGGLWREVIITR